MARELHDKVLFADAEMNRADWLTAGRPCSAWSASGLERANRHLLDLDWRLHELVITPVREIQRPEPAREER